MSKNDSEIGFSMLIRYFFRQRLIARQNASPQAVVNYRDTFRLFFQYTQEKMKKEPVSLRLSDMNAQLVLDFPDYLENERGNTQRSRNLGLAVIRSFMRYASFRDIESLSTVRSVPAIPPKRFDRSSFEFFSPVEVEAIIASPDKSTCFSSVLKKHGARCFEISTQECSLPGLAWVRQKDLERRPPCLSGMFSPNEYSRVH